MCRKKHMKLKEKQVELYKKEVADVSTFAACYIPDMCQGIYQLFGYETLDTLLSSLCLTAQYHEDTEKCLKQIRACFRMANMRYPLDLSVYEDTTTGRVLIITHFMANVSKFLYGKDKEPMLKEDLEPTPLKAK